MDFFLKIKTFVSSKILTFNLKVKNLFFFPPKPHKFNSTQCLGGANAIHIIIFGSIYITYYAIDTFNFFECLGNLSPQFSSSFINIPNLGEGKLKIVRLAFDPLFTQFYSGIDICSCIGSRSFHYFNAVQTSKIPMYLFLPLIGIIVHNLNSLDLSGFFANKSYMFEKKIEYLKKTFLSSLSKAYHSNINNKIHSLIVNMNISSSRREGDNNRDNPNKPNHNKDKLIRDTKKKRYQLLHQLSQVVIDLESLVLSLSNLLRSGDLVYTINPDSSSSLLTPPNMSDNEVESLSSVIQDLELSIRAREESIQDLLGQVGDLETILTSNNTSFGDTTRSLTQRILVAMSTFFTSVQGE